MPLSSACILLASLLSLAQNGPAPGSPVPLRLSGTVFGDPAEIEVRDLTRATAERALAEAWDALIETERSIRQIEAITTGTEVSSHTLDAGNLRWLSRTGDFCSWSDGATSALGGAIDRLWGVGGGGAVAEIPTAARLQPAIDAARCNHLRLDQANLRIELDPGVQFELRHFSRGWAVDRAVEKLRAHGGQNFWVRIGGVARGGGGGPGGRGWTFELPLFPGLVEPLSALRLIDQAVAVADPSTAPIEIAGERFASYIDLRNGRPASGVSGVVVVSELAGDAQPLAAALFVFGANVGQMRLGVLRPRPGVLWLLGSPQAGAPVLATANWSSVKKQ